MAKIKSNTAPSLELAISNGGIPDVLKALEAKMKEFEFIRDSKYKTSGNLDGFGDIKKETLITNLLRAYSVILAKYEAYEAGAADLGFTTYPAFEINGGSLNDWKADILLRKAIIEQKENMDQLQSFKDEAAKFMSEADQKQMFFAKLGNFLSSTGTPASALEA
jgi:hypothetical protein